MGVIYDTSSRSIMLDVSVEGLRSVTEYGGATSEED
jgi:hypothetical protein